MIITTTEMMTVTVAGTDMAMVKVIEPLSESKRRMYYFIENSNKRNCGYNYTHTSLIIL